MAPDDRDAQLPRLHWEETGRDDGPVLALVHGFLSSNAQWMRNTERLGRQLRLVLVEQPGHGRSEPHDDPARYTGERVVAAIDRIRETLGLQRWWVGGHSLGGAVALRYALTHPDRTAGVVFTNTRAAFGLPRVGAPPRDRPATEGLTSLRDLPLHPIHATRFPDDVQAAMVAAADDIPFHVVDHLTTHRDDWACADELGRLSMPVLLVNGRWERRFQPCVEQARQAIADLEVVDLEGGHSINVEQAEAFDAAVLEWMTTRTNTEDTCLLAD
ncbi:MAG: alpha/beta fold hydrolase [Actinomycetota bacterium]